MFAGVLLKREPLLSIPNRKVKALEPDDTYCFGGWESRVRRHTKVLALFVSEYSLDIFSVITYLIFRCFNIKMKIVRFLGVNCC